MSAPPVPATYPWRGRYVVLAGVVLVALNLRIAVAAVSPILDEVRQDVALTPAEIGLLGTVPVISFAVFGSIAPALGRRFGLEPTLVAAMLLSVLGELIRSLVDTSVAFLGWSVIALAGMGMGNVLLPPLVKRYFPDRIGPVTAVYSVVMTFSTSLPALLALPLADRLGWRVSVGSWALVGVVAAVPWTVMIVRSATARAGLREVLRRAPTHTPALDSRHRSDGRVWRSPLAWGMAVAFGMNSLTTYVLFAWLPQILVDAGVGAAQAGRWLALYGVLSLPGALVGPVLAARLRNPFGLVVGFVAMFSGGFVGLMVATTDLLLLWIVLLGLGGGTFPIMLTLINLRTRTSAGATSLSGFTQGIGYTLAGIGPLLVGILYEATGTWTTTYLAMFVAFGVLVTGAAVACRPVMLEDTWGGHPPGAAATPR